MAEYDLYLGGVLRRLRKMTENISFEPEPSEYKIIERVASDRYVRTYFMLSPYLESSLEGLNYSLSLQDNSKECKHL